MRRFALRNSRGEIYDIQIEDQISFGVTYSYKPWRTIHNEAPQNPKEFSSQCKKRSLALKVYKSVPSA